MGKYFGTDGFRGEANKQLTVEHAFKVGRFIGWYYGAAKDKSCKVVIGKDTRRSSYMFEYALVAGLTASGADVYLLHVTTTPSVAYVVRTEEDFDCGIMISASHNPYYDNGIKLINDRGEKMAEDVIAGLKHILMVNPVKYRWLMVRRLAAQSIMQQEEIVISVISSHWQHVPTEACA